MSRRCNIILAGVGGQGVLSLANVIAASAMRDGLYVKQSEVHGMAQRGGAVQAHLRMSDAPIASDLVAKGTADLIISMEPLESLRYLPYLRRDGTVITSTTPTVNIPDYPELDALLDQIRGLPHAYLVDADQIAKKAGSPRAANMVLVGAASHLLPVSFGMIERLVEDQFRRKGTAVVKTNVIALRAGRQLTESGNLVGREG